MPTTAGEHKPAEDALQPADKEMDGVRDRDPRRGAVAASPQPGKIKAIAARVEKLQKSVAADQAKVAQLTAEDTKASGKKKDELNATLNLAKAQQELDQDEVDDGKEDLLRAGGDQQARIQALMQQHGRDVAALVAEKESPLRLRQKTISKLLTQTFSYAH